MSEDVTLEPGSDPGEGGFFDEGGAAGVDVGPDVPPESWGAEAGEPLGGELWFGELDLGAAVLLVDSDYSGSWNHAVFDFDGDDQADMVASVQGEYVAILSDVSGDGQFGHSEIFSFEELAAVDPALAELLEGGLVFSPPDDAEYVPTQVDYASVTEESPYWFEQAANGLCVPASIAQIVSLYSGEFFDSEAAFVDMANEYGLFMVGHDGIPGMTVEGALFLMEQAGVPASLVISANIDMLDGYLDAGHGVVLFVNSSEIWYGEQGTAAADHALVLTDIDHDAGVAILSDPGHPDGDQFTVPVEVLEEAWAAGDNTMLIAEQPAPGVVGEVAGGQPAVVGGELAAASQASTEPVDIDVPGVGSESVGTTEFQSPIPEAMGWLVQRPWVLLPVALGARQLLTR
jgi:hypothetical protein